MGIRPSFPFQYEPVCFVEENFLTADGRWKPEYANFRNLKIKTSEEIVKFACNPPEDWQEDARSMYERMFPERQRIRLAREKFRKLEIEGMLRKWPDIDINMLLDLRAFFLSFDVNCDCLIDFEEFCMVLDELGDSTSERERRRFFNIKDSDSSGALDFEEFLDLFMKLSVDKKTPDISNTTKDTEQDDSRSFTERIYDHTETMLDTELKPKTNEIDFNVIKSSNSIEADIGEVCQKGRESARILRQLNVKQQVVHGLF